MRFREWGRELEVVGTRLKGDGKSGGYDVEGGRHMDG